MDGVITINVLNNQHECSDESQANEGSRLVANSLT